MQNDEAGCLPLINSWITIWQSLIIYLLHTVLLFSTVQNSHRAPLEKDIALCATVLSFWEHFILLFWSASYILLTLEHAHCSLALNLALLRLFNCWLHCSCLPAALALVLNCSSSLSIWSGNTLPVQLLPEMFCYQTSWSQLMVEPLILAASSWSHFQPS